MTTRGKHDERANAARRMTHERAPRGHARCWLAAAAVLGLGAAGTLSGCQPAPLSEQWVEARPLAKRVATWQPPRYAEGADQTRLQKRVQAAGAALSIDEPIATLTLPRAIALSLLHSPELATLAWDVRKAEADRIQAALSPNPVATYGAENLGLEKQTAHTLSVGQVIELAGKRQKRIDLATTGQRLAGWDYEARRLAVVARVGRAYMAVLAAQRRVALSERTLGITKQVFDIVAERVKAGRTPPADRDRAAVRVSIERIALDDARHRLSAAKQTLASLWGGKAETFKQVAGDTTPRAAPPAAEVLMEQAAQSPTLARWDDEIKQRQQAITLARANGVQDVTVGAGIRHFFDPGDIAGVIELSMPLPLFNRNQGRVLAARYALGKARSERRAAEATLRDEVSRAHAAVLAASYAMSTLDKETLPAARSALASARQAFTTGRSDFLDVLDAERTLVDVERSLIDAQQSYFTSVARIEGLIGAPLPASAP